MALNVLEEKSNPSTIKIRKNQLKINNWFFSHLHIQCVNCILCVFDRFDVSFDPRSFLLHVFLLNRLHMG